ncbi:hypothetical protein VPHD51_0094 [Vibrio phage D51]
MQSRFRLPLDVPIFSIQRPRWLKGKRRVVISGDGRPIAQ